MNNSSTTSSNQRIDHILTTLYRYRVLWIAPAVLGMILSVAYVLVLRQETWSAKQSLIVRDDLLGQSFKPGRFESIESMKSAQETILEIARKPQVIRNTLEKLGPKSTGLLGMGATDWPSEEIIEEVQGSITFSAPNGAEFGKTEVIVLNTKSSTRERSRQFIELLLSEIIDKVDEVRTLRLQSMETELTQVRDAAMIALNQSRSKLQEMDEELGTDVGAMVLNESQSSDNTLKGDMSQIHQEKRGVESELASLKAILSQLLAAQENPEQIISISGELIKYHPVLDDLKKELIKSQWELAVLSGPYHPEHPKVMAAMTTIESMQQRLFLELEGSIAGLRNNVTTVENQLARLNFELGSLDDRLLNLGSKRAVMLTLVAELKKRTENANNAQSDLAEIQGLAQARNADLLTPVDDPQVSTRPDGMGKKAMVLAGGLGGLFLGLGMVMLVAPPIGTGEDQHTPGRNASEPDNQTAEGFFDSNAFEKIVTRAAAAAATASAGAIQSANKAAQYFATSKTESEPQTQPKSFGDSESPTPSTPDSESEYESPMTAVTAAIQAETFQLDSAVKLPESPTSGQPVAEKTIHSSSTYETSRANSVVPAATTGRKSESVNAKYAKNTPTIDDLLAAATAIAAPENMPSKKKFDIPSKWSVDSSDNAESDKRPTPNRSAKIQLAKPQPPLEFKEQPTPERKPQPSLDLKEQPPLDRTEQATLSRESESTVSVDISHAPALAVEELASIQLAALRGKHSSAQPSGDNPIPVQIPALDDDGPVQIDVLDPAATPNHSPVREDPQTIVVANMPQIASASERSAFEQPGIEALKKTMSEPAPDTGLKRRGPNARPVDLAKSIEADDATFVRVNTQDAGVVSDDSPESTSTPSNESPGSSRPNPFLKDRLPVTESTDDPNLGVPDQIRRLSESIANFANPIPTQDEPKDQDF